VFRAVHRELAVARLQSDFVSAVSHEFRTPLAAMRHLTDRLEEGKVGRDRVPEYYRALNKEMRRLHDMVESLLDFGRIDAGRKTYELQELTAIGLVSDVVEEVREQRSLTPERLELQPPNGSDADVTSVSVRVDRDAIALALRNVIDNAIKYSPEVSTVTVSVSAQDGFAGISVEDRGAGIPRREQQEIFRKFVRGADARTSQVKGSGLGLTMADEIVRAHGGRVDLTSVPGQGSRFTIRLPVSAAAQAS
jgi:signal transduction histidine kinase